MLVFFGFNFANTHQLYTIKGKFQSWISCLSRPTKRETYFHTFLCVKNLILINF